MAIQLYNTIASRNLIRAEMRMLKHAEPIQVVGSFGDQKEQPLHKTDTAVFRRLKPFNATASEVPNITAATFVTSEGTTPTAHSISYTDVTAVLSQYSVLFKFSSKAEHLYEDDIPQDMAKVTGETVGEIAELVAYGFIKAGSSVIYANGSARNTLNSTISINKLRQAARSMESNRAKAVTSVILPGEKFGTTSVEAAYVVFCHTDMVADCRALEGFTKRVDYGSAITPVHPREFGACEDFRFVSSPVFAPYLAAGQAVGAEGMLSVGSANYDVYPIAITAESAWGHISLKGKNFSGVSPTIISSKIKNHANPAAMFGFVGADFWYTCSRLNENWMTRVECCASDLG